MAYCFPVFFEAFYTVLVVSSIFAIIGVNLVGHVGRGPRGHGAHEEALEIAVSYCLFIANKFLFEVLRMVDSQENALVLRERKDVPYYCILNRNKPLLYLNPIQLQKSISPHIICER